MRAYIKKSHIRLFLTGFAMGTADTVPGVSGGTIAFILGVYEELIFSIKKLSGEVLRLILKRQFKKALEQTPLSFLLPLGLGLTVGVISLARLVAFLLENHPIFIWSFFFGLMVASIFIVKKRVITWGNHDYLALIISAIVAYFIVGLVPVETPATTLAFFLAGAIAIIAMILPGVSGSFFLVLLGKYEQVLTAITTLNILPLLALAFGAILGLALFSRVLSWAFANHHDIIISSLTGFMIGSLRKIWPWKMGDANALPQNFDTSTLAIFLMVIAFIAMIYLDKFGITKEQIKEVKDKKFAKQHKKALQS